MRSWGFSLSRHGPFPSCPWSTARASQWLAKLTWKLRGCVSVAQTLGNLLLAPGCAPVAAQFQQLCEHEAENIAGDRAVLTQQRRKRAAGRSGGSWVRNKYQSHTLWESWGSGNPGFHCALVVRGCCTCRGMELEHCAKNLAGASSLSSWWGGEENQPYTSCLLFCAAIALQRAEAPYPACLLWLTIQLALIIKK